MCFADFIASITWPVIRPLLTTGFQYLTKNFTKPSPLIIHTGIGHGYQCKWRRICDPEVERFAGAGNYQEQDRQ